MIYIYIYMKSEVRFTVHIIFINNVRDIPGYFYKKYIYIYIKEGLPNQLMHWAP